MGNWLHFPGNLSAFDATGSKTQEFENKSSKTQEMMMMMMMMNLQAMINLLLSPKLHDLALLN